MLTGNASFVSIRQPSAEIQEPAFAVGDRTGERDTSIVNHHGRAGVSSLPKLWLRRATAPGAVDTMPIA